MLPSETLGTPVATGAIARLRLATEKILTIRPGYVNNGTGTRASLAVQIGALKAIG